ncbi:MAG: anti-sigma factor family protein [Aureliella sp.]
MSSQPPMGGAPVTGAFDSSSPDDEQLVAYLDGELDGQTVAEIETKLATDPHLRTRLNDLRSAWDLLEELPPVAPNPKFARSTIEMVAMSAASQAESKRDPLRNWRVWSLTLLVLPLMFAAGYAVVRSTQRLSERQALEVLPVLADWDALKLVERYDWLEKIRSVQDLDRVAKRSSSSGLGVGMVPESLEARRDWIEHLSDTGRDRLSANLEEFNNRTTPAQRQRITALAAQIYSGPDPQADLQAARDYAQFLNELGISERTAHLAIQDDAARLDDLTRRVNRKMVDVYTQELPPDAPDREAIRNWIQEMQDQYGGSLPRNSVLLDLGRRTAFGDSVIDDVDLDYLLETLTPQAQEIINRLKTPEAKYAALILFVFDTQGGFFGAGSRRNLDRAQLTERFNTLPPNRKGMIEFLPPDAAQRSLGVRPDARPRSAGGAPAGLPQRGTGRNQTP